MRLLVLLIYVLIGFSDAYNILCLLPYEGKSHYMVFEPLLDELTARGHNLTVVSFFPKEVPRPNRRDVSLVDLVQLNVEIIDLKHCMRRSPFDFNIYFDPVVVFMMGKSVEMCGKVLNYKMFEEFVKGEGQYDVILSEHFFSYCMFGIIHNYGVPSVGLVSSPMLPAFVPRVAVQENPAHYPHTFLPFTEEMTFWERVQNTVMTLAFRCLLEFRILRKEQILLENKIGRQLPALEDIARNTSVMLVNTYHLLNGVKELPPAVVEVGGLHLHNRTVKPLTPDLEEWVSQAEEGVILFSFGSLIRGSSMPEEVLAAFVAVFARLPQRVLWKWESDAIKGLPPNVKTMKWLPQYDLLNHPKCVGFITHGGLLSLTEAVAAGVPMLSIPVLGDQGGNAAHARRAGVATVLRLQELDEERLYRALNEVLSEEMRSRAKVVSSMWSSRPVSPMALAVHHVEWVARFGGPHCSSHARWLPLHQLLLLDVFAFLLAIVLAPVLIITCLCKRNKKKLKQS